MNKQQVEILIKKYNSGLASPEEIKLLENWYAEQSAIEQQSPEDEDYLQVKLEMWENIKIRKDQVRTLYLWPRIVAAASILLFIGIGFYFYNTHNKQEQVLASDFKPGSNKAILTLGNGQQIVLTGAKNGQLALQGNTVINKTAEGKVIYNNGKTAGTEATVYNTLETPKGGQYQVKLPDGTEVWLNAASSLKYPTSFVSLKDRKVTLTGEGYFQVAKDKAHPFIVTTTTQDVKVLGTHFNINSYSDEPATKTTLLEGSVRVNSLSGNKNKILKPGEQSSLTNAGIGISEVDVDEAVAWKNGKFVFNSENIESVMRKLGRWYNVEIEYQGDFKDRVFTGSISRYDNISRILNKIKLTRAVNFKIEGRRITVMP